MPVFIKGAGGGYATEQITNLSAQVGFSTAGKVILTWTNPSDENFKGLVIRRKTGSYPTSPTDGISVYDSNDSTPASTVTTTGLIDGTQYFFRAFAYCYEGATRVYNDTLEGASVLATPLQTQGIVTFTASGTFVVPAGVEQVEVFLVGGGGSGGTITSAHYGCGGGGGGYAKTIKNIIVTAGNAIPVIVGSGGAVQNTNGYDGNAGGVSSFGINTANGGKGGIASGSAPTSGGGAGGSGGGAGGYSSSGGAAGGSNGGNGLASYAVGGTGQGTTTKAFEETTASLYAGGGGGAGYGISGTNNSGAGGAGGGGRGAYRLSTGNSAGAVAGTANTGGGGGGGECSVGGAGGSGIVIVRWGY